MMRSFHNGIVLLGLLALTLGSASGVRAEEVVFEPAGLKFVAPKGWKVTKEEDAIAVVSPDEALGVHIGVTDDEDVKQVLKDLRKQLKKLVKEVDVSAGPEEETVNDLTRHWYTGTGKAQDKDVSWELSVVEGGEKNMIVIAIGDLDKHQKAYHRLFRTIKKAE